jgi:hypothetical protein
LLGLSGIVQFTTPTSSRCFGLPAAISRDEGPFADDTRTVGHDEQPLAAVRRTHFFRAKQTRRNLVTQAVQVMADLFKSQR